MTFRNAEIRVEPDDASEGIEVRCSNCDHPEFFHPDMVAPPEVSIWCAECGHDFGPWGEVHRRLFVGGAMLSELLSRPAPPTD